MPGLGLGGAPAKKFDGAVKVGQYECVGVSYPPRQQSYQ